MRNEMKSDCGELNWEATSSLTLKKEKKKKRSSQGALNFFLRFLGLSPIGEVLECLNAWISGCLDCLNAWYLDVAFDGTWIIHRSHFRLCSHSNCVYFIRALGSIHH